jgi:serine protease Do
MKKLILSAAVVALLAPSLSSFAQDETDKGKEKGKKESQEIIIRKKGDKDAKITIEISDDKVTINGKPLSDFKDDNITINKRYITIRDRNGNKAFEMAPGEFLDGMNFWKGDGKEETYPFLGVTTEDAEGGAKINEVSTESAAEKAGLKKDDIITKVDDKKINGPASLSEVIRSYKPKDEVTIYYNRDGKDKSVKVTLGEKKESTQLAYAFSAPGGFSRSFSMPYSVNPPGVSAPRVPEWDENAMEKKFEGFENLFPRNQKLGLKIQDTEEGNGVRVLDVDKDSPAEKAGLKKDDIVTEVGGKKVSNTDETRELLQENKEKPTYTIKAKRNGSEMSFDIKIPKKLKTANL